MMCLKSMKPPIHGSRPTSVQRDQCALGIVTLTLSLSLTHFLGQFCDAVNRSGYLAWLKTAEKRISSC
ncbi:hypothetical protein G5714_000524 [Onychostoma macrolepis]|uniref:Uncharacterized protein n=1 Tax=Onychostoma macrolepis TaxID=369639 RepID=A0A7J6DGK7_9TELE|nr:hypothetical protein G5714_000524 [Onychostoma macrolepis]